MPTIKRIVTSEIQGRTLSDNYGDNSYLIAENGRVEYYGPTQSVPVIGPGVVYGANADSGDGFGYNTIKLVPHAPSGEINDDRYLIIDPTAPNHIHIRAGGIQDASNAELILGAEQANVKVTDWNHQVAVNTYNNGTQTGYNWTFVNDGTLYGPGDGSSLAVTGIQTGAGINSLPIYSNGGMTLTAAGGDMNLYMDGGLYIGASSSENQILKQSDISNVSRVVPVPANATDTGTAGQIAVDSSYLYVCVATNNWKRVALSTW